MSGTYSRKKTTTTTKGENETTFNLLKVKWNQKELKLEEHKLASITRKKYPWQKEFEKWKKTFRGSRKGKKAIAILEDRFPLKSWENYSQLEGGILRACFLASKYNGEKDSIYRRQSDLKALQQGEISDQIKSIKKILSFMKKPEFSRYYLDKQKHNRAVSKSINKRKNKQKTKTQESLEELENSFKTYNSSLKTLFQKRERGKTAKKIIGPLIYPKIPPNNASRESAINGLLLNLVFLFRQFSEYKDIKSQTPHFARHRKFPQGGKPYYALILEFFNATLPGTLNDKKIRQRVLDLLTKQKVKLSFWPDEIPNFPS